LCSLTVGCGRAGLAIEKNIDPLVPIVGTQRPRSAHGAGASRRGVPGGSMRRAALPVSLRVGRNFLRLRSVGELARPVSCVSSGALQRCVWLTLARSQPRQRAAGADLLSGRPVGLTTNFIKCSRVVGEHVGRRAAPRGLASAQPSWRTVGLGRHCTIGHEKRPGSRVLPGRVGMKLRGHHSAMCSPSQQG
jgi:hypothetical protein